MKEIYPEREGYYWVRFLFTLVGGRTEEQWVVAYWRSEEWWEVHTVEGHVYANDPRLLQLGPYIEQYGD